MGFVCVCDFCCLPKALPLAPLPRPVYWRHPWCPSAHLPDEFSSVCIIQCPSLFRASFTQKAIRAARIGGEGWGWGELIFFRATLWLGFIFLVCRNFVAPQPPKVDFGGVELLKILFFGQNICTNSLFFLSPNRKMRTLLIIWNLHLLLLLLFCSGSQWFGFHDEFRLGLKSSFYLPNFLFFFFCR